MSALNKENLPLLLRIPLGSLSADALLPGFVLNKRYELKSAKIMNGAAIAASDTDYVIVELKKGSTVVAEIDTRAAHENGLAQNVSKALNIVSGQEVLEAGDYTVNYNETDAGTNVALTNALLMLELVKK